MVKRAKPLASAWRPTHLEAMKLSRCQCVLLCLLVAALSRAAAPLLQPQPPVEIRDTRGGFGALVVDDPKRRLLLAHTGNGTLDVIDLNTGKVFKQIKTGAITSLVVDVAQGRYYASGGGGKLFTIMDRETLEIISEFALPGSGEAMVLGPSGVNRVFVANASGPELWVVDAAAKTIAGTISVPAGSSALVAEDGISRIYVSTTSDDSVQVISAADNNSTIGGSWSAAPAKKPQALALDPRGERRLFVAGVNGKLVTLAAGDGQRIGINDIPMGVTQISLDLAKDRLYCPSGNGKMAVFDTRGNFLRPLGEVATVRGAKSIAIDPATHAVWLAYTEGGKSYARKFTP